MADDEIVAWMRAPASALDKASPLSLIAGDEFTRVAESAEQLTARRLTPFEPDLLPANAAANPEPEPLAASPEGRAFVSYVRDDADRMDAICAQLHAAGVTLWRDLENLVPGTRWRQSIRDAIRSGGAFIAFFSASSERRDRSYMRAEILEAAEELRTRPRDRPWFIPVRLDRCEMPALEIGGGEVLSDLHYIDVFDPGDGAAIARLVLAINTAMLRPDVQAQTAPDRASPSEAGRVSDRPDIAESKAVELPPADSAPGGAAASSLDDIAESRDGVDVVEAVELPPADSAVEAAPSSGPLDDIPESRDGVDAVEAVELPPADSAAGGEDSASDVEAGPSREPDVTASGACSARVPLDDVAGGALGDVDATSATWANADHSILLARPEKPARPSCEVCGVELTGSEIEEAEEADYPLMCMPHAMDLLPIRTTPPEDEPD